MNGDLVFNSETEPSMLKEFIVVNIEGCCATIFYMKEV
jgi:hypothetical protein